MDYTIDIDELNVPKKERSMPFEKFFGEMDLTPEQKKKRIEMAEEFEDMMWYFFEYYNVMVENGTIANTQKLTDALETRYLDVLRHFMGSDEEILAYVKIFAQNVTETTVKHSDDDYYTSNDRARLIAENESLSCFNNYDYLDAIASGKTRKRWIAIVDDKTRDTHLAVNGKTIPINDYFFVGDSLMRYPHDLRASAQEVINCRCSISYL